MQKKTKNRCIYCCCTEGSFKKKAHLIPESASNEDILLPAGSECDRCNQKFSQIEQQVINNLLTI